VAIIRYFLVHARRDFNVWATFFAPILGAIAMVAALVTLLVNRSALSGAGDAAFIKALPWVIIALFFIGVATAVTFRARSKDRYDSIGSFTSFYD
jgi:amino acid transporter